MKAQIIRTRVLVAGALAVPLLLGTVAVANAEIGHDSTPQKSTSQSSLTKEGQKMVEKSGKTSGSITLGGGSSAPEAGTPAAAGPGYATFSDGSVIIVPGAGSDAADPAPGASTVSGQATLTEEGQKMVQESGKTSGSVSAGPDGITQK